MKKHKTMNEVYGDGSNHLACRKCGLCLTCGDCKTYGCEKNTKKQILKF